MAKKRLVFIAADDLHRLHLIEWPLHKNFKPETFDVVATFEEAIDEYAAQGRLPVNEYTGEPDLTLVYAFHPPTGNIGLLEWTTDLVMTPGEPFRLSKITRFQTEAGMMSV